MRLKMDKHRTRENILIFVLLSFHVSLVELYTVKDEMDRYMIPPECSVDNGTALAVTCNCNNTEVEEILGLLPSEIQKLTLQLNTDLHGHYPVPPINLCNISKLTNLEYLQLAGGYLEGTCDIIVQENTFENLTLVKELHINIVTVISLLDTITKHMIQLEVYDITGTAMIDIKVLQRTMSSMNKSHLHSLLLSNFQMPGISGFSDKLNISAFFNTTQLVLIKHLDLSRNMLGVIYPSIIRVLPNLAELDISQNNLLTPANNALMIEMWLHPTLEILNLKNQGVGLQVERMAKGEDHTDRFKGKPPETVVESDYPASIETMLSCVNENSLGNLTHLVDDSLAYCGAIRCVDQKSLHTLNGIPCETFGQFSTYFDCSCPYFFRFPILKNLKQLIASNMNWVFRPAPAISPKLCFIDSHLRNVSFGQNGNWIKNSFLYKIIELMAFTSSFKEMEQLYLNTNELTSLSPSVLLNLHTLDLTDNYIIPSSVSICNNYPNLRFLSLKSNNLSDLPIDYLQSCKKLQQLDLSKNMFNLSQNPISIKNSLQLRSINLNQNRIDTLPLSFAQQLDEIAKYQIANNISKLQVIFNDNSLLCQCNEETMLFLSWFQSTSVEIPLKSEYSCSSSQGQVFLIGIDIDKLKQTCFPSSTKVIVGSISVTIGIMVLLFLIVAMYYYRWRLQYSVMKIVNWWTRNCRYQVEFDGNDNHDAVKYDAFISYCADDRFWVHDCLMKTLESDQYGLKLCIHYRDFPLGEDILSVIVRSIRKSRRLIIVLSEWSIGRPWCQFEFQVALSEAMRRNIKLVVIKLGQLSSEGVDDSVAWVLDNHTFLEWHENKHAQKVFWFKLLRHMYGVVDGWGCSRSQQLDSDDVAAFAEPVEEMQKLLN